MSSIRQIVDQIISSIDDPKTIERWKKIAKKEIKAFAKRANPFKEIKPTNYYLYIDTESLTYGLILSGLKPNIGHVRGFSAPINKIKKNQKPVRVNFGDDWRSVTSRRITSGYLGAKKLETKYIGISGNPDQYFGIKKSGYTRAFGVVDDTVVPIYSNDGFVEYITGDSAGELSRILQEAGFTAISEREKK